MQDISEFIPKWEPQAILQALRKNPLDVKALKHKLDRIYMISSYNQHEYLPDVQDAFNWIKLANNVQSLSQFLESQRIQKFFLQDFVHTAIRYMILCRKFKMKSMLILTELMMVESLKLFAKYLPQLEKYPKMPLILKHVFDIEKQFFKFNYINQYPHLLVAPTEKQIEEIDSFVDNLSVGDRVDILKTQLYSKKLCWLPGTVKKITSLTVYVFCDHEKGSHSFDRKAMQVRPFESKKQEYQWRFKLNQGDQIDFMNDAHIWLHTKIQEKRELEDSDDETSKYIEIKVRGCEDWISITDPRIQKINTAVYQGGYNRYSQSIVEDYNDLIFDPEMTQVFIPRPQGTKSMLFIRLLQFAHKQLKLFDLILTSIKQRSLKIEIMSDLLLFISVVHPLFHKKFAMKYLNELTENVLGYISSSKQSTIRNFSKERYEAVSIAVTGFLKRLKPSKERKQIIEKFKFQLILRFLFSDFLDKKLQAVSLLTSFFRQCNQSTTQTSKDDYLKWIKDNKILPAIYSDKNHSQLISRSETFLKYYLMTEPEPEDLKCLLIWNEAILKLVCQFFQGFPEQIQNAMITKIKERENVTNEDALSIIKKTEDCEQWLLKNGGECWVQVAKQKKKREINFQLVFQQAFPVVMKITKEVQDTYDSELKKHFFMHLFENNYVEDVLNNQEISLQNKLDFAALTLSLLKKIPDNIFYALMPYIAEGDESLPKKIKSFFLNLHSKLNYEQMRKIFDVSFTDNENLENMDTFRFQLFECCFLTVNEEIRNIDKQIKTEMVSPHSMRRQKKQIYIIRKNPNQMEGMKYLLYIIFQNKSIDVTMNAIKFISFIFKNLAKELQGSIAEFEKTFLENCLSELYKVSEAENNDTSKQSRERLQTKYLKILEQIMSQSEVKGTDQNPSVNALFPLQKIQLRVIDHFNINKTRIYLEVPSNMTLYEVKVEIGKSINAYVHQMKTILNSKELDDKYNGHVIHTLDLSGDLVIEKKVDIPKVPLTQADGRLVEKAKAALERIYKEYSSQGLMSKKQLKKYHLKCVGENSYSTDSSVEKIFEEYDKDNDGYLTLTDFWGYYEDSSKIRESTVWENLQLFGVRNDLDFLDNIQIQYPNKEQLTKYLLFENEKFMKILFSLLGSENLELASASWSLLARLPLSNTVDLEPNPEKQYVIRYWLYTIEEKGQYHKLTRDIFKQLLKLNMETICITLKVAQSSSEIDQEIFRTVFDGLIPLNSKQTLSFHNKVILDNSLKILQKCLQDKDEKLKSHYLDHQDHYNTILRNGIMSPNSVARTMYCTCINDIIGKSIVSDFKVFESLFNLVYRIFDKCDKSTLTIEYFDLFTSLLQTLKMNEKLMDKLNINWEILTKQMIGLYKSHECTEASMNSKPDQVAQGLLRIITKLLNNETNAEITELVPFIFQNSLFPQNGKNKLKNAKSRQDAYELIYEICKFQGSNQEAIGLQKLFKAGFKEIYKKMSAKKSHETFSYYYYSYNQARSELGYAGIRNLGCVCYMISMLQQLYMTEPFRKLILMAEDGEPECLVKRGTKQIDDNIYHQFRNMFAYLLLTEKQEYNPDEFCFSFKDFEGQPVNVSVQQDAQEFLNIFFDKLETSLKNTPFRHIMENIYGGKSCSQMICSGCGAIKQRTQTFYPFSLEIKGFKNVYESFEKYISGEVIQDYQCDSCNKKCDVTKKNFLEKTPNYFIVHLQRMCFNYDKFENEKVNSRYSFPPELNVYNYTISKQKGIPENDQQFTYSLRGVVLHYGTADFGHYFSYIKESDSLWLQFNDERVRELDPNDIQLECFGGEHWRRQSQNAYLLVYERQKKSNVTLSFKDQAQKELYMKNFKLDTCLIEANKEKEGSMIEEALMEIKQEKEEKQGEGQQQKKEKRVQVNLDISKIPLFVPKDVKQKIEKENDEFSFTINLSNEEFAQFIYHILSIDPPKNLKPEFLELCYESFHLKQMVTDQEDKSIGIAEWASKRFKELIDGYGLQFLQNVGQNWDSDIISIERSTRMVTKNLLNCIITDIIKTSKLNQIDFSSSQDDLKDAFTETTYQKEIIIVNLFLNKLSDMMLHEISKHWQRLKEYFDLWIGLVKQNIFVRTYCKGFKLADKIFEFILEDSYPYQTSKKRYPMGTQYYPPDFQYPIELLQTLLKMGYKLSEREEKCLRTYAFMDKVVTFRIEGGESMIKTVCENNRILSQKMAYLLLNNCEKVTHSDQAKPIIASIYEFLHIEDDLKKDRIQWIIGFPIYFEHQRTKSYGSYGIYPDSDSAVSFLSPVNYISILQWIVRLRNKTPHSPALFISMILQLEKEGLIYNLDEYPSYNSFEECYTSWIGKFVTNYYEENHRPYTYHSFIQYANRLKKLWEDRPNRPFMNPFPRYIIGKTVEAQIVKEEKLFEKIEVSQWHIKSYYLPFKPELRKTNMKVLKKCKTATNFIYPNMPEKMSVYSHSRINNSYMKLHSSEEEEQVDNNPCDSYFEDEKEGYLLKKICINNISNKDLVIVISIKEKENCNVNVPTTPMRLEIKNDSICNFTLIKKDIEKDYGEMEVKIEVVGKFSHGYYPSIIITPLQIKGQEDQESSGEQDSSGTWY